MLLVLQSGYRITQGGSQKLTQLSLFRLKCPLDFSCPAEAVSAVSQQPEPWRSALSSINVLCYIRLCWGGKASGNPTDLVN